MERGGGSHVLVAMQLLGIGLAVYAPGRENLGSDWALLICSIGFAIAMWTLFHNRPGNFGIYPEPKDGAELVTTGPYEIVRHPMYLSLIVMMVGIAVYNNGLSNFLGAALVVLAVGLKARKEEAILCAHFDGYAEYRKRTFMIIPRIY